MVAEMLQGKDVTAAYYHAGLRYKEKMQIQSDFGNGNISVVVATNAFGMGIDVPDVRKVIHLDVPPSIEEYYQEIGRAGRDGKTSDAVLLIQDQDLGHAQAQITKRFVDFDLMAKMYKAIMVYHGIGLHEGEGMTKPINYEKMSTHLDVTVPKLSAVLKLWQSLGVWEIVDDPKPRVYCKVTIPPKEMRDLSHRYPDLYPFAEYLMRSYESLFDGWILLDINRDMRRLRMTETMINDTLNTLKAYDFIKVYRLGGGHLMTLLSSRHVTRDLGMYLPKYTHLKERIQSRFAAMAGLITSDSCRMTHILRYFGEEGTSPCGRCDSCIGASSSSELAPIIRQRHIHEKGDPGMI